MKKLSKIFDWIGGIAMCACVLTMVANILLRLVNLSVPGTYELVGYFSLIFASACIPICMIEKNHVTVDVLTMRLPGLPYRVLEYISGVIDIFSYVILAYAGYVIAFKKITTSEVSDTLKIPVGPMRLFWAVCVCVMIIIRIIQLVQLSKTKLQSREERNGGAAE